MRSAARAGPGPRGQDRHRQGIPVHRHQDREDRLRKGPEQVRHVLGILRHILRRGRDHAQGRPRARPQRDVHRAPLLRRQGRQVHAHGRHHQLRPGRRPVGHHVRARQLRPRARRGLRRPRVRRKEARALRAGRRTHRLPQGRHAQQEALHRLETGLRRNPRRIPRQAPRVIHLQRPQVPPAHSPTSSASARRTTSASPASRTTPSTAASPWKWPTTGCGRPTRTCPWRK